MTTNNDPLNSQVGGSHYKKYPIQPIEYAMANKLDYCQANVVKYVTRHADKNGEEDLIKAVHNIQILLKEVYGDEAAARIVINDKGQTIDQRAYYFYGV